MNKVILMGRLVADPEVRYGNNNSVVARYRLAVDRRFNKDNADQTADFISIVAFGKSGEFAEKYLKKATKVVVTGRIQTGSYKDKDGKMVYTTDVVAEDQEFAESKNSNQGTGNSGASGGGFDNFNGFPIDVEDDDLPFA